MGGNRAKILTIILSWLFGDFVFFSFHLPVKKGVVELWWYDHLFSLAKQYGLKLSILIWKWHPRTFLFQLYAHSESWFDFVYKRRLSLWFCKENPDVYSGNHCFISIWQDSFELGKTEQGPGNVDIELGLQSDLTSSAQPGFEGFFEQVRVFLSGVVDLSLKEHLNNWSTT